jgi:hypothetical protein
VEEIDGGLRRDRVFEALLAGGVHDRKLKKKKKNGRKGRWIE